LGQATCWCQQLLTARTGEQIWSLLDVLPDTFDKIPETLDAASKKDIVSRIGQSGWVLRKCRGTETPAADRS
jgi:hypothetical protein